MSDGTYQLNFIEPADFRTIKTLQVSANNYAVNHLNELEYIKGYIYANIWPTNIIMKINPADGNVVGKLDLTLLKEDALSKNLQSCETNGIAYDSITDKIYVTGKMWPRIYQIDFPH
jgi:glutamine cyclotransferase